MSRVLAIGIDCALAVFATAMCGSIGLFALPLGQRATGGLFAVAALWWLAWRFASSEEPLKTRWHYGVDAVLLVPALWIGAHWGVDAEWPSRSQTIAAALSFAAVPVALSYTRTKLAPAEPAFRLTDARTLQVLITELTFVTALVGASFVVGTLGSAWLGS